MVSSAEYIFVIIFCRLLQEEKDSAEMKAQEIESQVGSQRLDTMGDRWRSLDQPSPPISGRSTPTRPNSIGNTNKYNTVSVSGRQSVMLLWCDLSSQFLETIILQYG